MSLSGCLILSTSGRRLLTPDDVFALFKEDVAIGGSFAWRPATAKDVDVYFPTRDACIAAARRRGLKPREFTSWDGNEVTVATWRTVRCPRPIQLLYVSPPQQHEKLLRDGTRLHAGVRFHKQRDRLR